MPSSKKPASIKQDSPCKTSGPKDYPSQLEQMKKMAGSYGSAFQSPCLKYKELGLKDKQLTENDYR